MQLQHGQKHPPIHSFISWYLKVKVHKYSNFHFSKMSPVKGTWANPRVGKVMLNLTMFRLCQSIANLCSKHGGSFEHFESAGSFDVTWIFQDVTLLGSVQVLYKQVLPNSGPHPSLNKQNKHGLRPPPLIRLYNTWTAIRSNKYNI